MFDDSAILFGDSDEERQVSYWPSVSDLFMTCFILSLGVQVAFFMINRPSALYKRVVDAVGGRDLPRVIEPTNRIRVALKSKEISPNELPVGIVSGLSLTADEVITALGHRDAKIGELNRNVAMLRDEAKMLGAKNVDLEKLLHNKPPIIKIAESGNNGKYRFKPGLSNVEEGFRKALNEGGFRIVWEEIIKRNRSRPASVDTLEIIGHTDGTSVLRHGNLDSLLPQFLASGRQEAFGELIPGSNNDLGLLRALAIKREWLRFVESQTDNLDKEELMKIEVRCYSAGQTIPDVISPADDRLGDPEFFKRDNEDFRRIEIRLTNLKEN